MRSRFVRLFQSLIRSLTPSPRRARHASPRAERLEERVALSGITSPVGCACPACSRSTPGAAYVLGGGVPGNSPNAVKWPQPGGLGAPVTITYSYSNLLDGRLGGGLSAVQIKAAVQEAFSRWAAVAPLRFVEVRDAGPGVSPGPNNPEYDPTGKPMIRLGHKFMDGGYGTLGYGYFPGGTGLAGDIHFDNGEQWTNNPAAGLDFTEVATHEIGHTLGLAHTNVATAVMTALYGGYFRGPGTAFLFGDDIAGIRALYGAGVGSVTPLAPLLTPGRTYTVIGSTLYIQGTAGNDRLEIDSGAAPSVSVNGVRFAGNLAAITTVSANLGAGGDVAILRGSSTAETAAFRPGQLTLTGPGGSVTVAGTEVIQFFGGASDSVTMAGSVGNDLFVSSPGFAEFRGPGFHQIVRNAGSISAIGNGGVDTAHMYDSAGNDVWTANPRVSTMQGPGYVNRAEGFFRVYATSSVGSDTAKLYDSAYNDSLVCGPASVTARNNLNTYLLVGSKFDIVQAFSTRGTDTATLYDTPGDDAVTGTPTFTTLAGSGFRVEVGNYARVFAISRSGEDEAYLYDSTGNDTVTTAGATATLFYPLALVQLTNFAYAALYGNTGGVNRRPAAALPLLVDWYGSWIV